MQESTDYTIGQLADEAKVTSRTIRYYIQQGLLPSPRAAGPGAHYDDGHLNRLRLIRRLQQSHLPLAEIRKRLEPLSDEDVHEVLERPPDAVGETAADYIRTVLSSRGEPKMTHPPFTDHQFQWRSLPADAYEPDRSQWERIGLSPDIELHVRRPLSKWQNRTLNRILESAREILEEKQR